MNDLIKTFNQSLQTGFIDSTILSDERYLPDLLTNQVKPPKKVLATLIKELDGCTEFYISVAFVTTNGVATIINKLKELEEKGIPGKILVSQYLNFTQPEALRRLAQFSNIELRMATTGNFHSKGYIFKLKNQYNLIIGSSNLTAQALTTNKEWNLKITALEEGSIVSTVLQEFKSNFASGQIVTEEFIQKYEQIYKQQAIANQRRSDQDQSAGETHVIPNKMQEEALSNLQELRKEGKNKALIISATGTGKTYLSAFDVRAFSPKTLLFVVHRLSIAKSSLETFSKVFGKSRTMGLFSGSEKELDKDFIFSTVQTISKERNLELFKKTHFEYIIIDETHRSAAESYARLINYFQPKFLLGMTATPERSDGNDIYEIFDHNIAYEIRLHQAMAGNMLCDFHYYGVTDLIINDEEYEDKSRFNLLISDERVKKVTEMARFYGTDDGKTRGLIFCSRKQEAKELSNKFNSLGFKTISLTGESSAEERAKAINRLESENPDEKLDYILTVDIFNEGIDIPKVNQLILLRPTESAIIFIQQLGRGLRKTAGKSYLTVVDFIGNYENNYLIPIALYGDTSYSKDSLRKLISAGSNMIPGASTVNFDKIAKEKIFKSIDSANMQLFADLKKDYFALKSKLGRYPFMMDFIKYGHRDPFLFVTYANLNSFYKFIERVEKETPFKISEKQSKTLELFYKEINNGKRIEESLILLKLIEEPQLSINSFKDLIVSKYGYSPSNETIDSCINNLNFRFTREKQNGKLIPSGEKYGLDVIRLTGDKMHFTATFTEDLQNSDFKSFLLDSIQYSIHTFDAEFDVQDWKDGFVMYKKYSRKDVFRILNVEENPVAQNVGGSLVSADNSHCPIFVNYHKEEHISESTKYEDQFVNHKEFDWMSKSNRKINSKDVQSILGQNGSIRLPLFIKKNNDEGMDFYYMGDLQPELDRVEQTTMHNNDGKQLPVVKIRFRLSSPVSSTMYDYLHHPSEIAEAKPISTRIEKKESKTEAKVIELRNPVPLYNFYAAAGSFSEMQSEKEFEMIEGPENRANLADYFACKVVGESMNQTIPNGSICLFKYYTGGSRDGKIMLIENRDIQDVDFNSAFTVKLYSSQKIVTAESWAHTSILLKPKSFDSSYKSIVINEENSAGMRVIGEFIEILS